MLEVRCAGLEIVRYIGTVDLNHRRLLHSREYTLTPSAVHGFFYHVRLYHSLNRISLLTHFQFYI